MHTELPWHLKGHIIEDEDEFQIASCDQDFIPSISRDNATLIVQCVNSYPDLVAALRKARKVIEDKSWVSGYGFYRPANPHHFQPDMENTEEEFAAHEAACEAYDSSVYKHGTIEQPEGMHILFAPWGPGSYQYQDEELAALLSEIDSALTKAQS